MKRQSKKKKTKKKKKKKKGKGKGNAKKGTGTATLVDQSTFPCALESQINLPSPLLASYASLFYSILMFILPLACMGAYFAWRFYG